MAVGELDQLESAIDALATVDPAALDDASLDRLVLALQRQRARLGAVAAGLVGAWDARKVWLSDGSRSAADRLARDTGCSPSTAGVELRRARQLRHLPVTAAAVGRGVLSLDHVDLLGRANQPHRAARMAEHEELLVAECTRLRYRHASRMVRYWCRRVDAEAGCDDGTEPAVDAELHVSATLDGAVAVNGLLDPIGGAIVVSELTRLEHDQYLADQHAGIERTPAQRRAAALVEMATRSRTAPAGGKRPNPLFSVLVGESTVTELCELGNGTVLTPRQLAPWLGVAELETILFDGPTTILSVSRKRTFTGALRRAIEVRDRHCQHPSGCDVPAEDCDVDHIVPYRHGGLTGQHTGRLGCHPHNRDPNRWNTDTDPLPARPVTRLDAIRARIRWRVRHEVDEADDEDCNELGQRALSP